VARFGLGAVRAGRSVVSAGRLLTAGCPVLTRLGDQHELTLTCG
jgi:hypothetical protein